MPQCRAMQRQAARRLTCAVEGGGGGNRHVWLWLSITELVDSRSTQSTPQKRVKRWKGALRRAEGDGTGRGQSRMTLSLTEREG